MIEDWKPVVGYEDRYEVSNLGRIVSLNFKRTGEAKEVSPCLDSYGYPHVKLSDGGGLATRRSVSVHVVVAAAFIGPRPLGFDINHIDTDKRNNAVGNLEYVTRSDNLKHAFRNGLMCVTGDKNPRRIAAKRRKELEERRVEPSLG